jgi:hypothetical protein
MLIKETEEGIWLIASDTLRTEVDLNEGTIKAYKLSRNFLKEKFSDVPERVWNFDILTIRAEDLLLALLKSQAL